MSMLYTYKVFHPVVLAIMLRRILYFQRNFSL